jgi:hypothetical protein
MQTRFESVFGVAHPHALLPAVRMDQAGGVQIERVAVLARGQPGQTPTPQRLKAGQVLASRAEALEEAREGRLAGHPLHAQQLRHEGIAPKIRQLRQLAGRTQHSMAEGQRISQGRQMIVRARRSVGQLSAQPPHPIGPMHPRPESRRAGMRTELLVGEPDCDCLAPVLKLISTRHRLVKRTDVLRLGLFHINHNHFPNGGTSPTESFRMKRGARRAGR